MEHQPNVQNERRVVTAHRLGRLPRKRSMKSLDFADFYSAVRLPTRQQYWANKEAPPIRSFGNTECGDCTRAKQAVAHLRMERLEQGRKAPFIDVTDEEVKRVYFEMTARLYGGGDTGAYEEDALSEWRKPDLTFKDTAGNPFTIEAFLSLDPGNQNQLKAALALAGAKGIALAFSLPIEAQSQLDRGEMTWDVPEGQALTGDFMPGSWGGHSVWAYGYEPADVNLDMTWNIPPIKATWRFMAAYCDEAHIVIDSVDAWRARLAKVEGVKLNLSKIVSAVNSVSSQKIKTGKRR